MGHTSVCDISLSCTVFSRESIHQREKSSTKPRLCIQSMDRARVHPPIDCDCSLKGALAGSWFWPLRVGHVCLPDGLMILMWAEACDLSDIYSPLKKNEFLRSMSRECLYIIIQDDNGRTRLWRKRSTEASLFLFVNASALRALCVLPVCLCMCVSCDWARVLRCWIMTEIADTCSRRQHQSQGREIQWFPWQPRLQPPHLPLAPLLLLPASSHPRSLRSSTADMHNFTHTHTTDAHRHRFSLSMFSAFLTEHRWDASRSITAANLRLFPSVIPALASGRSSYNCKLRRLKSSAGHWFMLADQSVADINTPLSGMVQMLNLKKRRRRNDWKWWQSNVQSGFWEAVRVESTHLYRNNCFSRQRSCLDWRQSLQCPGYTWYAEVLSHFFPCCWIVSQSFAAPLAGSRNLTKIHLHLPV